MPHPRCTVLPLPDHQVAFLVDGRERTRWHFGPGYPRPFFYPLAGPASGLSLTRMGHPGAPNHDHHRSIWFAHEKVSGVNFWGDTSPARIRQKEWLCYDDGDTEATMGVRLGWADGHDPKDLLVQDLYVAVRPGPNDETFLEVQTQFKPTAAMLEFGKTNFGFFAVRVAKALSVFFGGGTLTNSNAKVGEKDIFAQTAEWMDYSGTQPGDHKEGITFFDHPSNPGHPTAWHVREDGWMGAASCLGTPRTITAKEPLTLRYQLHAHRGMLDAQREAAAFKEFADRKPLVLVKAPAKHTSYKLERAG